MKFKKGSLFDYIHSYLKIYLPTQRRVSANTIRSYQGSLSALLDFVKSRNNIPLGDVTLEMLDAQIIVGYLDSLEREDAVSIATRNNRLAAIRAFYRYVSDRDVTVVAAFKEISKIPMKKPDTVKSVEYMSEAAITAIISQPDASTPKGLRDRFFMILLYDTGARIQEMCDVKLDDFRYGKTPTLTLHGKGGKIRTVPLMEKTVLHLRQYLDVFHQNTGNNGCPLFYSVIHGKISPLTADCIRKFIRHYGAKARENCFEVPENIHPHLWRHSRAMHLYQRGMDLTLVSQWLGHANLETTLIYAHADTEQKRKAIEAATSNGAPMPTRLSPARFTVDDENTLKRLAGLQ